MNKNILVGVGIVLALVLGLYAVSRPVRTVVQQVLGGTSPDIASPYVDFGGVRHWYSTASINQASSTVCGFTSPVSTSTLVFASVTWTTGTTTALIFDIGKGAPNTNATTTNYASVSVASGVLGTIVATTTPGVGGLATTPLDPVEVFAPNSTLNFKYGGPYGALNTLVGACKAEWIQNI